MSFHGYDPGLSALLAGEERRPEALQLQGSGGSAMLTLCLYAIASILVVAILLLAGQGLG